MNAAEKRLVWVFLSLFALGIAAKNLPRVFAEPLAILEDQESPGFAPTMAAGSVETLSAPRESEKKSPTKSPRIKKSSVQKVKVTAENPLAINKADSLQLLGLPGVGPAMAHKILEYRRTQGPFKMGDDLEKVPGIGKKKQQKLVPLLIFD